MNDSIIEITNVSKSFGGVVANRNVSLSVPRGRSYRTDRSQRIGQDHLVQLDRRISSDRFGFDPFRRSEISQLRVQEIARLGLLRTFQTTRIYGKIAVCRTCRSRFRTERPAFSTCSPTNGRTSSNAPSICCRLWAFMRSVSCVRVASRSGQQKLLEFAMALMKRADGLAARRADRGHQPDADQWSDRPLEARQAEIRHYDADHRAQHARHHEYGEQDLLSGPRRNACGWRTEEIQGNQNVVDAYLGAH